MAAARGIHGTKTPETRVCALLHFRVASREEPRLCLSFFQQQKSSSSSSGKEKTRTLEKGLVNYIKKNSFGNDDELLMRASAVLK